MLLSNFEITMVVILKSKKNQLSTSTQFDDRETGSAVFWSATIAFPSLGSRLDLEKEEERKENKWTIVLTSLYFEEEDMVVFPRA